MINLFNNHHNGDIFYSRVIVQTLLKIDKINYYHKTRIGQFEDINGVEEFSTNLIPNNSLLFDTWVGQKNTLYLKETLCSFYTNKKILKDILLNFNINVPNDFELLPTIDYKNLKFFDDVKFKIENLKKFSKKILICNNNVQSGQSLNFDFSPIVDFLSEKYPNFLFLMTNSSKVKKNNVLEVSEITKGDFDLLYISLISTYCDIIIGRASGPFCYCHVKENLMDTNKKFISICNNEIEGKWFYESLSPQIWTNDYDISNLIKLIDLELNKW